MKKNKTKRKFDINKVKQFFLGNKEKKGFIKGFFLYLVLIGLAFVFLYPILYMIVNAFFAPEDLIDPSVTWIPTKLYFGNFVQAYETLDFLRSFGTSVMMAVVPSLLQLVATSLAAFGLARFEFPLKKLWLVLIVATFMVPTMVMTIPRYTMFFNYHMTGTVLPFFIPAAFGQGIRSTIFILIFYSFFSSYPISFDEAAELDGAGKFKIYRKIALPAASGAIVLCLLFSFVWYWNETTDLNLFSSNIKTLPKRLQEFSQKFSELYGNSGGDAAEGGATNVVNRMNESLSLAGTLLSILPTVILYLILQKQFVESVERSGITGE